MCGRVGPRTSLKVVFTSCSGCSQSQNAYNPNASLSFRNANVNNRTATPNGGDRLIQEGVVSLDSTIVKILLKTICFKKVWRDILLKAQKCVF